MNSRIPQGQEANRWIKGRLGLQFTGGTNSTLATSLKSPHSRWSFPRCLHEQDQRPAEPIPVCEPLWEIDPLAGHWVSGQCCIHLLGRIKRTAPYLLWTGMRQVQDICNPVKRSCYLIPTTIQMTSLVLSESSDEESSDSDATWGWCSDSNGQGWAEQVAWSQIIVHSCGGAGDQLGVGSRRGLKAPGRSSSAGLWSCSWGWWRELQWERELFWLVASVEFVPLVNCSPSLFNQIICFLSVGVFLRKNEGKEGKSMMMLCWADESSEIVKVAKWIKKVWVQGFNE